MEKDGVKSDYATSTRYILDNTNAGGTVNSKAHNSDNSQQK